MMGEQVSQVRLFVLSRLLSSLWVSCTGSASDWCALQEALYKYIDTIQYNTIASAISQLKEFKSRDDYRELLELTIIFFGGIPLRGTHFQYPGAVGYIVLAGWRKPFFHQDGAVSKPVQCSEAAGSVPKRFISFLWTNSLKSLESVYLLLVSM